MNLQRKISWCLAKAEREQRERGVHRGLRRVRPNRELAREHIVKAEHYLSATEHLKQGGFSDISASTVFYAIYHCLLAIAVKFGYDSRNQECTFALIRSLREEGKINLRVEILDRIAEWDSTVATTATSVNVREQYQYGTSLSLRDDLYQDLVALAKETMEHAKVIIEE